MAAGRLNISRHFGGFELVRPLGYGQAGDVHVARRDGRLCTLKRLGELTRPSTSALERALRAVERVQAINHQNVVTIEDFGVELRDGEPTLWIRMPYIEHAVTLRTLLKRHTDGLSLELARAVLLSCARGLEALHEHHIVHRDLKPDNVIVLPEEGTAFLIDVDLARLLDRPRLTQMGSQLGTYEYMSPEQMEGEAEKPADQWALGLLIHEALSGEHPFAPMLSDPVTFARAIREAPPPPLLHRGLPAPADLAALAPQLLEKVAGRRITAEEVVDALSGCPRRHAVRTARSPWPRERRPQVVVQVDDRNASAVLNAAHDGHAPDGLVAAISQPHALAVGRTISRTYMTELSVDVLAHRFTEPDWWRTVSLQTRAHAPPEGVVLDPASLRGAAAAEFARNSLQVQDDEGADRFRQPSVGCRSIAPPEAFADITLQDQCLADRSAFPNQDGRERPVDAVVRVPVGVVENTENHIRLLARFAGRSPDGTVLYLDGLSPRTGGDRSLGALRLALLLQEGGQRCRVVCGGPLRRVLTAFGVAGIELMPGRREGLPMRRPDAAPGAVFARAATRFAFPSLLTTLPPSAAVAVLEHGLVPECACFCPGCAGRSPGDRVANATIHNVFTELLYADALDGIPPAERVRRLLADLDHGYALHERLIAAGVWAGDLALLRRLRKIVEQAIAIDLLEPRITSTRPARGLLLAHAA